MNSIGHPNGKPISLRLDNWHDKIESFSIGEGYKKVKLFDDDPGNFFEGWADNREYSSGQGHLIEDLEHDLWQIQVWANAVKGTPPFQPGQGTPPSNLPKPPKVSFNPDDDALYAEPKKSSGLNGAYGDAYFPNIGRAM